MVGLSDSGCCSFGNHLEFYFSQKRRDMAVEQGCQATAPSLVHLPERWRGGFPWQVSQLQTQGSALGGLPFPRLVSSPEVPFVGGILDVVANVVEHPMSRGAVAGIKHLEEVHCGTDGLLLPSSAPLGSFPIGGEPRAHSSCYPIGVVSTSPPIKPEKSPKRRHGV